MARKSGYVRRQGVMRRETLWVGLSIGRTVVAAAQTAAIITSANAALQALRPYTIVRTRGLLHLVSDQEAASEFQEIGYGHCVVSDQALAIGVTAVPTPDTDVGSDLWYVYQSMSNLFRFLSGVGVIGQEGQWVNFDSKAMRKVEDGEIDISVVETGATSAGVSLTSAFRQLIKLH